MNVGQFTLKEIIIKKKAALSNKDVNLRSIQRELNSVIKVAKHSYKEKVEKLFKSNQTCDAWKGLKQLSGFVNKNCLPEPEDVNEYVNDLNKFYARFDDKDFSSECAEMMDLVYTRNDDRIVLCDQDVLKALNRAKAGKACGPDKISGRVIKLCKDELVSPMKTLFQASLDNCYVPILWRTSEIVPVPKTKVPVEKNDLRPVALTCIFMKCFESIVRNLVCTYVSSQCDQLQFAYREGKSVDDAVNTLLHIVLSHLDKSKTYTRLLFIDFSSAFNTIQAHILLRKLYDMHVNSNLIAWIYSYLTKRPQFVRLHGVKSGVVTTNTGAPQGCVLSPLLFTLYTNDCKNVSDNCHVIKYADDTVIIGNITNNDEISYFRQVSSFVEWCQCNYLNLNVKKTMEMFVDFRKIRNYEPLAIMNENVKVVEQYKYLGVFIDNQLTFTENVNNLYKKALQRIHFLRILNNINVDNTILTLFYRSVVESIVTFCMTSWYGLIRKQDKTKLFKITKKACKLGVVAKSLDKLYEERLSNLTNKIMKDSQHPLNECYCFLRSGSRLRSAAHRTNRLGKSFVPSSIRLFNHKCSRGSITNI